MQYLNLYKAMQTQAACNGRTATEAEFEEAMTNVIAAAPDGATNNELAALDTYVATLNQDQLENLVDGCYDTEEDEGYQVMQASPNAELLYLLLDEMFALICA